MKKTLLSIFILMIIFIVACQQTAKQGIIEKKADVMEKLPEAPKIETTGEAVVDSVGSDLNNINSVEKDLSADELSDLDSGFVDIQNI